MVSSFIYDFDKVRVVLNIAKLTKIICKMVGLCGYLLGILLQLNIGYNPLNEKIYVLQEIGL